MKHEQVSSMRATPDSQTTVEILGLATAVPPHKVSQDEALARAKKFYPQYNRLDDLYANTGVANRYTVEPSDWYEQERSWEERTASFEKNALALLQDVAERSVSAAGLELEDIDVIITNTVTGLAIPSLEARLMNKLPFRQDVERLPIFGFGCGGGVAGLARAKQFAQAKPGQNILFMTLDLCTLCMRINDPSLAMFVSSALFGDGAVGVVLGSRDRYTPRQASQPSLAQIGTTGDHFWPSTEHIMGWDIRNDGFGVVLSPELPTLMRDRLLDALNGFLEKNDLSLKDFDGYLLHPGGSKILETAEQVLNISREDLKHSWDILHDYGNMSSATALFILKKAIDSGAKGRHLLTAFGPGFSAYFIVVDL